MIQMRILLMPRFLRSLTGVALFCCAATAGAGLFDDEEARKAILDLRQRIEAVRSEADQKNADVARRVADESAQFRRSLIDLQNQIEALRSEMANLRGLNEQLGRELSVLQRQQKDLAQSSEERFRKFEPVRVSVDGREFMAEPNEKRDFESALAIFRKGEFGPAQTAFVDFLKRFPVSGYGASALFWLGNAQYATRDYKEAVINFRAVLALMPDHARAPEAVLSIANCQLELKDTRGARKTLEDLVKVYPQSEAAVAAKERLTKLK